MSGYARAAVPAERAHAPEPESSRRDGLIPLVSVLVLLSERVDALEDLYRSYTDALHDAGIPHEFVFVAQPGFARALIPLRGLQEEGAQIRTLEAGQTVSEAELLKAAAAAARGEILVTLPAYRRVEPGAAPNLVRHVLQGADLALAVRAPRRGSWINRAQGALLHAILRRVTGAPLHDVACGVRAFRKSLLEEVPVYGDLYRFFPLFVQREGFRVEEIAARQDPDDARTRIYPLGVYVRRCLDLLGLYFLLRFTHKPLRFFGLVGSALGLVGAGILAVLFVQRVAGRGIADRPLLLLGVLLLVLGTQAIALGLIGEIVVHFHANRSRPYRERLPLHRTDRRETPS